ncbi:MAG: AEC family transporter [Oscillospiraceae bacterium]|nr:AEC family transporter [Oscillospiraceae bacterium]MBQ5313319.1 AEC family transporter [Oscillospiraceae bacterium]
MENFLFSINAVAPTFIIAFTGFMLKQRGFLTEPFLKNLDKYCFTIAFPALMIRDIGDADISTMWSAEYVLICFIATTFLFFGYYLIFYPFFKDKWFVSSFVQCCARGSVAVFGASIAINIYGNAGVTPLMMAIVVPLYNIYTVILFNLKSDNGGKIFSAQNLKKMGKGIITNPLIIGIIIGAIVSFGDFTIPTVVYKPLSSIASTGTPMALLSLGAGLQLDKIKGNIKVILASNFFKLVGNFALILPFAIMLGLRDGHLVALLIMAASPCTVTAYIMANAMGGDGEFSCGSVMMSTLLSTVTITFWLTVLKSFALI